MADVEHLTVEDVLDFHRAIMERTGQGSAPLINSAGLEGALGRARNAAYYEGADLVTQAVLLIEGIAKAHPFLDGNKRTAAFCGLAFLRINGLAVPKVEDDPTVLGRRVENLVAGHAGWGFAEFVQWLNEHVRPLE